MGFERIFERLLPHQQQEIPKGFSKEAGKILIKAHSWAKEQTRRHKLTERPFNLSEYEIATIQTRLAELRADQLLKKKSFVKTSETVDVVIKLRDYFQKRYQRISQQVIQKFEIVNPTEITAVWNYLENCKELAPRFGESKSDITELMGICNKIRGRKPIALVMKAGLTNT